MLDKDHWFLDIEASSLNKDSYPIEVGFVNAKTEDKYSYLINPDSVTGWDDWSIDSELIHNISRYFLWEYGEDAEYVAMKVANILKDAVVIVDSPTFDRMWLNELFTKTKVECSLEVISVAEILYDHQKYDKLKEFNLGRSNFHEQGLIKHNALDDAIQNKELLLSII